MDDSRVIQQTETWIRNVVVDCNFCPFAARALLRKGVRYQVNRESDPVKVLEKLLAELNYLDENDDTETSFLILPESYSDFDQYLDLVAVAEELLFKKGYEGTYQVASFHPEYCFEGADNEDPANYTNRSVYPMLHLLREESVTLALAHFKHPENIPERNVEFARTKGLQYMQVLRMACF